MFLRERVTHTKAVKHVHEVTAAKFRVSCTVLSNARIRIIKRAFFNIDHKREISN